MNADYTYDRDTDQFVVTLDDGTEVCRTRAPHTQLSKETAVEMTALFNSGMAELLSPYVVSIDVPATTASRLLWELTFSTPPGAMDQITVQFPKLAA